MKNIIKIVNFEVFRAFIILTFYNLGHLYYMLTSLTIPSGDGRRVLPFVEFAQKSLHLYPLWNPYNAGGAPVITQPERFVFLSWILPSTDSYFFYNLLYILGAVALSFSFYLFARALKISFWSSIVGGVVITSSQFFFAQLQWGRIEQIYADVIVLLTAYFLVRWLDRRERWLFGLTAIGLSLILQSKGYYASVYIISLMLFIIVFHSSCKFSWSDFIVNRLLPLLVICFLALGIAMIWLLPMLEYSFASYTNLVPISNNSLLADQPKLFSFINIFFPVLNMYEDQKNIGSVFYFISPLLLPCIGIYLITRDKLIWPYELLFSCLLFLGLFFCLGEISGIRQVIEWISNLPLISNIRYSQSFQWLVLLSVILFSLAGLDRFSLLKSLPKIRIYTFLFTLVLLIGLLFWFYLDNQQNRITYSIDFFILISFIVILCLSMVCYKQKTFMLTIISLLLYQSYYLKSYNDYKGIAGQVYHKDYIPILSKGDENYRVSLIGYKTGLPKVRSVNGFSMYFSAENKLALGLLYGGDYSSLLRPSWIKIPPLAEWNSFGVELLNLKYVEIGKHEYRKYKNQLKENWDVVDYGDLGKILLKKKNWRSSLMVFDSWIFVSSAEIAIERVKTEGFRDRVFIEGQREYVNDDDKILSYDIESNFNDEQQLIFNVRTNKRSMLFIPEYYDPNWEVYVNGKPSPLLRANGCCRVVELNEGKSIVKMIYKPSIFYVGVAISAFTLLIVFIFCFIPKKLFINKNFRINLK